MIFAVLMRMQLLKSLCKVYISKLYNELLQFEDRVARYATLFEILEKHDLSETASEI